MPGQQAREDPDGADAVVTALLVKDRVTAMLAHEGGGPRVSGHAPVAFTATFRVVEAVVEGTELSFAMHGEKALRANCGGILGKDEGYGFVFVDMVHGKLAPRGNGPLCAIPLGEKLRKLNKKRKDEYEKRKRAAGKEPADKRAASLARVEVWHQGKLREQCASDLSPFVPPASRCAAVTREEIKVKRERPRAPSPPPLSQLQQLAAAVVEAEKAADAADAAVEAADEALSVAESEADRADARLGRLEVRPEHQWPFYINSGDPGDEEGRDKRLAEFERWAAAKKDVDLKVLIEQTRRVQLQAVREQSRECATHWRQACEARTMALQAAATEASLRIRIKELELEKGERLANAPMRKQIMDAAVAAWGPDHSSRPPLAVHNLRGP